MIVCRTCGGHNADTADFCGTCGEFLEWTGEKLAPPSSPPFPSAPPSRAESTPPAAPKPSDPRPKPAAPPPEPLEPLESLPKPTALPKPTGVPKPAAPPEQVPAVTGFRPAVGGFRPAVGGPTPAIRESTPAVSNTPAVPSRPAATSVQPAGTKPQHRAAEALVAPLPPKSPSALNRPTPPIPDSGPVARKPQPQEMRPQAPVRRRPTAPTTPSPPTRELQPDDLICGTCGEGNAPTRRFCSRCGESLQTATVVPTPPTPWWRKILGLFERKAHPAGARPKRRPSLLTLRGLSRTLRRMLFVALLLAGLFYAVFPSMRSLVNGLVIDGKDRVNALIGRKDVAVRPISTTATAELPDHPAGLATDLMTNTFWSAPDAARPKLMVVFDHPTRLTRAIVHNGDGTGDFPALDRPRELHLVYFDDSNTVLGASDVTLNDTPSTQEVQLAGSPGATRVEIEVRSVHPAQRDSDLALSEIEFFERQ